MEFEYDDRIRRVAKRVYGWRVAPPAGWVLLSDQRYLWDGWRLLAEFDAAVAPGGQTETRALAVRKTPTRGSAAAGTGRPGRRKRSLALRAWMGGGFFVTL